MVFPFPVAATTPNVAVGGSIGGCGGTAALRHARGRPSVCFRPSGCHRYSRWSMSTRRLIILSLLCGVAILLAFMVQLLIVI